MLLTIELIDDGGDCRGKIFFFKFNNVKTNLFELKKGYARGGHFHDYDIVHTLVFGRIEHRTKNLDSKKETIEILSAPAIIKIPPKTANLIIALENSLFTEIFDSTYKSITFDEYREIVYQKMNNSTISKPDSLKIYDQIEDLRGKIFFCKFFKHNFNLIELKKNYARGGHFHEFDSQHVILSGKIKYFEKDLKTNIETTQIVKSQKTISTKSKIAHMFLGMENSLFIESFSGSYSATYYPEYRNIIEKQIDDDL